MQYTAWTKTGRSHHIPTTVKEQKIFEAPKWGGGRYLSTWYWGLITVIFFFFIWLFQILRMKYPKSLLTF
jgi:hypothetical protein